MRYWINQKHNHPEWYRGLSFHDNDIINVEYIDNKLILTLCYDLPKSLPYKICFYDYEVIEDCNLINAWIIKNELYLEKENNQFHLLLESDSVDDYTRTCFKIKFKKMEMIFNEVVCSLGDDADESHNPDSTKIIFDELCKDSEYIKDSHLKGSKIVNVENTGDCFVITLTSFSKNIEYKILLNNYEIVKNGSLINSSILSNELYIKNNENKLHLFVMNRNGDVPEVYEFEIKFKTIKFNTTKTLYQAGDGIDESLNPEPIEIATSFFSEFI